MNLNTEQYFSQAPDINAPRSVFDRSFTMKTTMNVNNLYPIFIDEALPGDSMKMDFQVFGRLANPLVVPIMDELYLETLWFQCPNRLLWSNWFKFCGEQENPNDSVDYVIPTVSTGTVGSGNFATYLPYNCVDSLLDHFGIPPYIPNMSVNALPFRMYNRVYNEWFRDENLINSSTLQLGDSDVITNYPVRKSAKMHDYFTACMPFAQKFGPSLIPVDMVADGPFLFKDNHDGGHDTLSGGVYGLKNGAGGLTTSAGGNDDIAYYESGLSGVSIPVSDIRFAFKLQRMKEIQALSGTRYIEWVKANFNVNSLDARAFRTEFLGSTREMIDINTVIQTSSTDSTSPQGHLTAYGVVSHHGAGFSTSFTEHGYLMGIARIRHNPIYQQGLHKMWKRKVLLDFYLPVFNGISEQPVYSYEIYANSDSNAYVNQAFGFQEAWAEYRYKPSMITGLLRSKLPNQDQTAIADLLPLDVYHLAQVFSQRPQLNQSFIEENIPLDRALSVQPSEEHPENTPQFIMDFRFNYTCARPMPVRNIPDSLGTGARF